MCGFGFVALRILARHQTQYLWAISLPKRGAELFQFREILKEWDLFQLTQLQGRTPCSFRQAFSHKSFASVFQKEVFVFRHFVFFTQGFFPKKLAKMKGEKI